MDDQPHEEQDPLEAQAATANGSVRTAFVTGVTFAAKPMRYEVIDGLAVVQGDIVIGTVEQVEAEAQFQRMNLLRTQPLFNNVIPEADMRWPGGVVPFVIDAGLPNPDRVHQAIAHWHERTGIRFVDRTDQGDYLRIVPHASLCNSAVGRQGGEQLVRLTKNCGRGQAIHELFHALGAWHEQCRDDRDAFIRIDWDAVQAGKEHNFDTTTDNVDVGAYDYGSVMHYSANAFGIDGRQTIFPLQEGVVIGQRDGLSDLDVQAVEFMYPGHGHPAGPAKDPKAERDDVEVKDPKTDDPKADILKEEPKEEWEDPPTMAKSYSGEWGEEFSNTGTSSGGRMPFVLGTGQAVGVSNAPAPRVDVGPAGVSGATSDEALTRMHQSLVAFTRLYRAGRLSPDDARAWNGLAAVYADYVRAVTGRAGGGRSNA